MAKKIPVAPRRGTQQMSEHYTTPPSATGSKGSQVQPAETHRPPTHTHREDDDDIFGVTRLSADQVKTARALHRLFQSLCGGQPGQYWPQALLDSAGRFNRPIFPSRDNGGRQ
jgi:hypothetical protein